jgi:hypothetical protein
VKPIARPSPGTAAIARCPLRDERVKATRDLDVLLSRRREENRQAGSSGEPHLNEASVPGFLSRLGQ